MKKIRFISLLAFCILLFSLNFNAQTTIANFDFNSAVSYPVSATSTAPGVTATTTSTEAFGTFGGTATDVGAFTANTTAGNALAMANSSGTNTRYFQLNLSGASLSTYSSYRVYAQAQRSGTGAQTVTLAYSTDGTNFTNFGTTLSPGNGNFVSIIFDVSGIVALNNQSNITFRLLASGASGAGTLRIDNLQVQATGPSAASGTVAGRVKNIKGRGLKFVTVMINGGELSEPLYATTNQFGNYQFEDIPLGNSYVLQVFSRRYSFEQSSLIVNLTDSITDADFIGDER